MYRSLFVRLGVTAIVVGTVAVPGFAHAQRLEQTGPAATQDVLAAEADGLVELRFIANDARSAQVLVTNRGDRPLTLELPPAFAGVPVLAQQQAGAGFGAGGIGAQPQNVGGGGGGAGGGLGGGAGGGGNPFCWVAREIYGVHDPRWLEFRSWMVWEAPALLRDMYTEHGESLAGWLHDRPVAKAVVRLAMDQALVVASSDGRGSHLRGSPLIDSASTPFTVPAGKTVAVRATTVCLDHGLREPTPRMAYRLVALDTVEQDPRLAVILGGLATGHVSQKVAQAAAWHLASGLTWEKLAAEKIDRAGGDPDVPFFSAAELASAQHVVAIATKFVGKQPATVETTASEGQK